MTHVLILSGSPSEPSRTDVVLDHIADHLHAAGHTTGLLRLRSLPAGPMLRGDTDDPPLRAALQQLSEAGGIVVGSPVYKATYSGLLKSFTDLLPMDSLDGVPVLPILTGGSPAHVLALDYGLKPLLSTLGASNITPGRFVPSRAVIPPSFSSPASLTDEAESELYEAIQRFTGELRRSEAASDHMETQSY